MSIVRRRAVVVAALLHQAKSLAGSVIGTVAGGAVVSITRWRAARVAAVLAMSMAGLGSADAQSRGAQVFSSTCTFCHFTDTTDRKVGPGLMGLFRREQLPVSGDRVSDERVRKQIRQGSGAMPPHGHLSAADVEALVEYLKTL